MKKLFIYLLITFIIMGILTLLTFCKDENKEDSKIVSKLNELNNIDDDINYFIYKNIDRYISYKEKNPNMNITEIIKRVNLNLDYPFYENTNKAKRLNKTNILVNKYYYLPNDYIPNNLVEVNNNYDITGKLLVKEVLDNYNKMKEDLEKDNLKIRIVSAYRSYQYQLELYNKYKEKDGIELADTYSARPGYSEHQTGLCIDVDNTKEYYENFENTQEFKWMQNNSYKYGFILRYPKDKEDITGYKYESWHYRYVGKKIAKYIHDNNICFEEYYMEFLN